ncbi:fluoride efflux transporter FluC [Williamsia sp. MIQD14]|uniref:fluoride efflux transporter FluC n=1 Tax=Williamsia sp. MIQD14 TaxID=3425703 RepID=UPI003DA0876E
MRAMLAVFVGGLVGTAVRYAAERVDPAAASGWPWATFIVNLVGATILGALVGWLAVSGPDVGVRQRVRLFVGVGFCGSLTTYSAFALESDRLLAGTHRALGLSYVVATVVAGVGCAAAGFIGARRVATR